jgi:glycosyltransferase involved in cell wall biosynthesis
LQPLIENAGLRKTMGQSAWKLVETHYTWDRVAEMTQNAYREYLQQYPARYTRN